MCWKAGRADEFHVEIVFLDNKKYGFIKTFNRYHALG